MKANQARRNRLLWVSLLIIIVVTLSPGNGKIAGNYLDKVAHFGIFFILSINVCYKFQKDKPLTTALLWAILFGLLTEVLQQFIPGRNMDMYDGIADTLGVVIGFYIYTAKPVSFDKLLLKMGA